MNTKLVLLACTTRFGSTEEVAEAITTDLRQAGNVANFLIHFLNYRRQK